MASNTRCRTASCGYVSLVITVNDLQTEDLPHVTWAGSPSHVAQLTHQLERAQQGHVAYLAVRVDGHVVSIGGVDFTVDDHPEAGVLWQLATNPELQGQGYGTRLVRALEERVRARALAIARLEVDLDNERARALYERLGYTALGRTTSRWTHQEADGSTVEHVDECVLMQRLVSDPRDVPGNKE